MGKKILVAYASRYGSTAEIARVIGEVLRGQGYDVEVVSVKEARDVGAYRAVIIGSSLRVFHLLPEAIRFARRHRFALAGMPTAYFAAGLMMKDATPENLRRAEAMLNPLRKIKKPVATALFPGRLQISGLERPWRFYFRRLSPIPEGDYRDWDAVKEWAVELAGKL